MSNIITNNTQKQKGFISLVNHTKKILSDFIKIKLFAT